MATHKNSRAGDRSCCQDIFRENVQLVVKGNGFLYVWYNNHDELHKFLYALETSYIHYFAVSTVLADGASADTMRTMKAVRLLIPWHKMPGPRLNIKTVLSTYGDFR